MILDELPERGDRIPLWNPMLLESSDSNSSDSVLSSIRKVSVFFVMPSGKSMAASLGILDSDSDPT